MRNREDDPFLRMSSLRHGDILADGAVELLRERGVDALTMRALAAWMKVTPSALSHRASRPETVLLLVEALGKRWLDWSTRAVAYGGSPALPRTMLERHGVRVWVLLRELAATEAAHGRAGSLEMWQWFTDHEDELVLGWWRSYGRPEADYASYRLLLDGARLALAFDASRRLADVERHLSGLNGW